MTAIDVDVNPGETVKLGLNLLLKTADLAAGKYEVKLLIDGKLQDETLEVIVLDNVNTVKEINVEGVKATGTAPTFSVQLPLGKKVEDVTVEASDITLNSTKATVIELKQATDKKSWTFKVEAEDGTKSAEQTLNLVETKINTVTVSLVDDKTVKVVVKDNQGTPAPVKGLKAADFEVTVTDGTVADGMDVESIVESNTEDGVYQIKLTKDLATGNKVTVTVSEVVGTATK